MQAIEAAGFEAGFIWHRSASVDGFDCVVLPGGFAHGDYLRAGAIARFSPVMDQVREFALRGGPVLGICNGFQVLLEAGLLPGAMLPNTSRKFVCRPCHIRVETTETPFTSSLRVGQVLMLPIAHGEGNYYADPATLAELEASGRVVFRYSDPQGRVTEAANPNGSAGNIAGICSPGGNVFGLMPHPERASEEILGGTDGRLLFESVAAWVKGGGGSGLRDQRLA
jgi:phosphoribosylformylglycinamidine synthase